MLSLLGQIIANNYFRTFPRHLCPFLGDGWPCKAGLLRHDRHGQLHGGRASGVRAGLLAEGLAARPPLQRCPAFRALAPLASSAGINQVSHPVGLILVTVVRRPSTLGGRGGFEARNQEKFVMLTLGKCPK